MLRSLWLEPAAGDIALPACSPNVLATVTALRPLAAQNPVQAVETAQQSLERMFSAGLDLNRLMTLTDGAAAAGRLRRAIGQLDAVINEIFALMIDLERRR
jgi:hypothetical protein